MRGLTIAGNTLSKGAGCQRSLVNFAAPYYLVNVTGLVGSVSAAPPAPPDAAAVTGAWGEAASVSGANATADIDELDEALPPPPAAAIAVPGEASAADGAALGAQQAGSGTLT